jgi:PAS domain S-box-containing protein
MLRILHVDDNESDQELIGLNLRRVLKDHVLDKAESCDQALKRLSSEEYDCLLCDYQMPGMTGLELLKLLRSGGDETPFIFLTGQGNEEIAAEALRSGADDYFTKDLGFAHYHQDERRIADERIKHLNLVLKAIRQVNQLITKESDIKKVLSDSCACLIETRGYKSAWIALMSESGCFNGVVGHGLGEEFSFFKDSLLAGNDVECISRAQEQHGMFEVGADWEGCETCPLHESKSGNGSMVVRLEHAGRIFGVLRITHAPDLPINEEERSLFKELAGDLAFALHREEKRIEHERAEEELKESERRYRTLVELSPDATYVHIGTIIAYANKALSKLLMYSHLEQIIGLSALEIIHPDYRSIVKQRFSSLSEEGEALPFLQCQAIRRDGSYLDVESTSLAMRYEGNPAILTVLRDISKRKR